MSMQTSTAQGLALPGQDRSLFAPSDNERLILTLIKDMGKFLPRKLPRKQAFLHSQRRSFHGFSKPKAS